MKRCNIYKFKRNSRSNWLLIICNGYTFLRIQGNDLFYIPESAHKRVYLEKYKDYYNLVFFDKNGFKTRFEAIDKREIKRKHIIDFLNQVRRLPKGVRKRIKEKHNIR